MRVTEHAIDRYIERIDSAATRGQARDRIASADGAVECAADFGARCVRLGDGAGLILCGTTVVTVLGKHHFPPRLIRPPVKAINCNIRHQGPPTACTEARR